MVPLVERQLNEAFLPFVLIITAFEFFDDMSSSLQMIAL